MALAVNHSTVVVVPDDGTSPVGTNEWNAQHTLTGVLDAANGGTGSASGISSATQTALDGKVAKAGDTMTNFLSLHADPSSALHAATKQYVDSRTSPAAYFVAYLSSGPNVPNEAWTKINFNTVSYNVGSYFNTSTYRWTPPAGAVRLLFSWFGGGAYLGTPVYLGLYKNGVFFKTAIGSALSTTVAGGQVSAVDVANGTDYYEAYVFLYTGSTAATVSATTHTWFEGTMV